LAKASSIDIAARASRVRGVEPALSLRAAARPPSEKAATHERKRDHEPRESVVSFE
jgi:hypothetical protein